MKSRVLHLGGSLFGIFLFAAAYRWFLLPDSLYSGGFTGISQLLSVFLTEIFRVPARDLTGLIVWLINLPLFFLGYKSLGRSFFIMSALCVTVQSLLMAFLPALSEPLLKDPILSALAGGLLSGYGVGLTLRSGGSGGGLDILGMYAAKNSSTISVGKAALYINLLVYGITAVLYDLNTVAYSLLFSLAGSYMTDKAHHQNIQLTAVIVSSQVTLGAAMNQQLGRGVTVWKGWGEHLKQEKYLYMIVTDKYEWQQLKKLVQQKDPDAFLQLLSPRLVMGNFIKKLEVF